mmetsp:Transcript_20533/g.52112  ORF Transcript_20533/g.52112 Transcript_20533/m.52112 type:complete len:204 (-) Transcript_20533:122-733(-)
MLSTALLLLCEGARMQPRHHHRGAVRSGAVMVDFASLPEHLLSPLTALVVGAPLVALASSFGTGVGVGNFVALASMPDADPASLTIALARLTELESLLDVTQAKLNLLLDEKQLNANRVRAETNEMMLAIAELKEKLGTATDACELQENASTRQTELRQVAERKLKLLELDVARLQKQLVSSHPLVNFVKGLVGESVDLVTSE